MSGGLIMNVQYSDTSLIFVLCYLDVKFHRDGNEQYVDL